MYKKVKINKCPFQIPTLSAYTVNYVYYYTKSQLLDCLYHHKIKTILLQL